MAEGEEVRAVALQCPHCGADVPPVGEQIVCQYCGSALVLVRRPGPGGQGDRPIVVNGMRLKPFSCRDDGGTGLEVFRMLTPVGWEFRGGVTWSLDNPGMPATVAFALWNPNGAEAFEVFPNINFVWNSNPLGMLLSPTGHKSFGMEMRAPMGAPQMLREIALPRYRGQMPGLQVIREEHLPDLPRQLGASAQAQTDGAKVRIQYDWGGHRLEEEVCGVVEVFTMPTTSLFGGGGPTVWLADFLFSFRAYAGRLDATADLFRQVGRSLKLNPHWRAAVEQITTQLCQGQIRHIRQIGQMGQQYAQTMSDIRESRLDDWYANQAVMDGIMEDVSQTIRGVDAYYDPYKEQEVELPGGYGHAWTNDLGEYIVTDNPNFNPNLESNLSWQEMPQQ